jgi:hypothetical protein
MQPFWENTRSLVVWIQWKFSEFCGHFIRVMIRARMTNSMNSVEMSLLVTVLGGTCITDVGIGASFAPAIMTGYHFMHLHGILGSYMKATTDSLCHWVMYWGSRTICRVTQVKLLLEVKHLSTFLQPDGDQNVTVKPNLFATKIFYKCRRARYADKKIAVALQSK